MAIELPGKSLVKGYESGGQANMNAGSAPWSALGGIGQQLAGLGEKGAAMLVQHQELAVKRKAAEMELEFDQLHTAYEAEMLKNPNLTPDEALAGWEKQATAFSAKYTQDGMSPLEQDVLGFRAKQLTQRGQNGVIRSSLIANERNMIQSSKNLVSRGEATGNDSLVQQGFEMMRGVIPDAEIESEKMNSGRRVATNRVEAAIAANPLAMREQLKDPEKFVKDNPGVHIGDVPKLQSDVERQWNRSVSDSVDSYSDGVVTGAIKNTDDIERIYKDRVPPRTLEEMKINWSKRQDFATKQWMDSPTYQATQQGEMSQSVDGLKGATGDDFANRYAAASFGIGELKDSPGKLYLQEKLKAAKEGREIQIKTHADAAFKSLDDLDSYERAKLPETPKKMNLSDAVQAGFLQDKAKIQSLGFSEDQAGFIVGEKTNEARMEKMRDLWTQRKNADANVPQDVWQTAMAIRTGSNQVDYISPKEQDAAISAKLEADRLSGERRNKLSEFLQVNPDAKPEQIDQKILEIGGEQTQKRLQSGIYERPSLPKAGTFIPGETSMNLPKNLEPLRSMFVEEGLKYGVDPRFLAAISMHETGEGKSDAFKNKNNAMGVSNSSGPIAFGDTRESITKMAKLLGNKTSGPYKDSNTLAEIAGVYAPIGAENDPKSLNGHWPSGVSKYYKQLGGNPALPVR